MPDDHLIPNATWDFIDAIRQRWDIPGVSIAVVAKQIGEEGEHVWKNTVKGFGKADSSGKAVTPQTLFLIASNSKLFTALAVAQLIEDGTTIADGSKLSWESRIKDVFPGWTAVDEVMADWATLQDAASMVLGFPDHSNAIRTTDPSYALAALEQLRPTRQFRETMQYNNLAYVLLQHLIDVLSPQRRLDKFIQERILDPLDMNRTIMNHQHAARTGRRAENFVQTRQDVLACPGDIKDWSGNGTAPPASCRGEIVGAGWMLEKDDDGLHMTGWAGIITSGDDMVKWLRELLDPKVFSAGMIDRTRTAYSVFDGRPPAHPELGQIMYGQGQFLSTHRGHNIAYHTGTISGHNSVIARLPDAGLGVAVLTNGGYNNHDIAFVIARRVLDDLLGLDPVDWEGRFVEELKENEGKEPKLPPADPTPPSAGWDHANIAGRYVCPGYGDLIVQAFNEGTTHSRYIADLPPTVREPHPKSTFIAHLRDSLLLPHMVLSHFDGDLWNFTAPRQHIAKDASVSYAAWPTGPGQAVIKDGKIGFGSNFAEVYPDYKHAGRDLTDGDEGVDVWFERVGA